MKLANAIKSARRLLFGYTFAVFFKRVRYFFYLRFTKVIFRAKLPISIFYNNYIDKEKLLSIAEELIRLEIGYLL